MADNSKSSLQSSLHFSFSSGGGLAVPWDFQLKLSQLDNHCTQIVRNEVCSRKGGKPLKSRLSEFIRFVFFTSTSDTQVERHVKFVKVLIDFKHRLLKNHVKHSSNTILCFMYQFFTINDRVNKSLRLTIHITARRNFGFYSDARREFSIWK